MIIIHCENPRDAEYVADNLADPISYEELIDEMFLGDGTPYEFCLTNRSTPENLITVKENRVILNVGLTGVPTAFGSIYWLRDFCAPKKVRITGNSQEMFFTFPVPPPLRKAAEAAVRAFYPPDKDPELLDSMTMTVEENLRDFLWCFSYSDAEDFQKLQEEIRNGVISPARTVFDVDEKFQVRCEA